MYMYVCMYMNTHPFFPFDPFPNRHYISGRIPDAHFAHPQTYSDKWFGIGVDSRRCPCRYSYIYIYM